MIYEDELPETPIERATMLESIMTGAATDGSSLDNGIYEYLRREFMVDDELKNFLPSFVRSHRNLSTFRSWTQKQSPHWQPRRDLIADDFRPLFDSLEGKGRAPGDTIVSAHLKPSMSLYLWSRPYG